MSAWSLVELRRMVLLELDEQWRTASGFRALLGLGGSDWYRLCLVLERLANDGVADIKGLRVRKFRRA